MGFEWVALNATAIFQSGARSVDAIIEAEIPIAEHREGRRIPRFPLEVVAPVYAQYVQEAPLNHLDIPYEEMPQTRADMKDLLDRVSRWLN